MFVLRAEGCFRYPSAMLHPVWRRTKNRSAEIEKSFGWELFIAFRNERKLKDGLFIFHSVTCYVIAAYRAAWKMKGIFRKSMEEGKAWGVSSSTAIRFLWGWITRGSAEMCTNVRKCAQTSGNMHKWAASAVRLPNFAVKTEAHGTETHRKEGGTSMGGENRE